MIYEIFVYECTWLPGATLISWQIKIVKWVRNIIYINIYNTGTDCFWWQALIYEWNFNQTALCSDLHL